MADDLSLLFKIRGDASGLRQATAESRAAVNQLKQSFGPELNQTVSLTNKAFSEISDNLNVFVGQRIPLVGGAFVRVTENLRGLGSESKKTDKAIALVANSIQSISTESGKSIPQISQFLTKFVQIEGQAKRDAAAVEFFGTTTAIKLIPQLEKVGEELATVSAESAAAGSAIAGMALSIGIAVAAVVALIAAVALASKELFELTKRTADFQGKMLDLSQATGLGVETLSTLEVAAKTTGGSLDSLAASLGIFQRKLEEAQDPESKSAANLQRLGVEAADTEVALRQTLSALARMPEGAQQTALALELFGRGGRQVLAILKETNGDLDALTQKLRDAGVLISSDAARAADQLNDQLALLDFQIRAAGAEIVKELIPPLTDLVRNLAEVVRAAQPLLGIIGDLGGPIIRTLSGALRQVGLITQALTLDFKGLRQSIKEVNEEAEKSRDIPALNTPSVGPTPLPATPSPQDAAKEAATLADAVVATAKRSAAEQKQALSELFEKGRIGRQQQAEETIAANKRVLEADKAQIDARLEVKDQEARALNKREDLSTDERIKALQKINDEAQKLQQQRLDAESLFETTSREIRARAAKERADSLRNEAKNETDILLGEFDRQIKIIESQIERQKVAESDGLTTIEQLEQAKIEARRESVEKQKQIGFLSIQDQKDFDAQIRQLNQDADRLRDEQIARRLQREREASERTRQIKLAEIDTTLELQRIVAERTIASIEALTDLRIKSEEQAAREILQIKLDLIDEEIKATEAKLKATSSIVNVNDRKTAETDLNNQLKILAEQRKSIQAQGNREIEGSRQEDLRNERRYADELRQIKEEIRDIELDAAREVIRLMQIHFASRKDIIRARRQLDIDEENSRHEQAEETLRDLQRENSESKKSKEEKLEFEKEINRLREAEAERHRLAMKGITDQGKRDEDEASPFGRIGLGTDDLKEFASVIEDSIVPLGEILRNTFLQVADAIGQTVQSWVLLGETGPAVMRKILAQALASIAAEAAVNAIKELALGFATLFFAPEESASHFIAAGLWASIAGVSAIAGRAVAGDLFKPKTAGAGGRSGGGSSSSGSGARDPIDLTRTKSQTITIVVRGEPGPGFNNAVINGVVDSVRSNGPMRTVIKRVAEDS